MRYTHIGTMCAVSDDLKPDSTDLYVKETLCASVMKIDKVQEPTIP